MADVMMCDQVEGDPAVAAYRWAWGEEGMCGHMGRTLLQQRSKNLKRTIEFSPLPNQEAPPIGRDERTKLIAERLSAEAELEDSQRRSGKLAASNAELAAELRSVKAREAEGSARIADLERDLAASTAERARLAAENGRLAEELGTARAIIEAE
jgi:hypothetical protein